MTQEEFPTRELEARTLPVDPPDPARLPLQQAALPATSRRYVFDRLLDKGGMGEVYRVHDTDLNRPVAMKIVHQELDRDDQQLRFVDEAQITGQLDHPNIVPVYELGRTEDGRLFFTMKEVRGKSLADVLDRIEAGDAATREEWSLVRMLQVMQRVCDAMAFAHARGVVHRDLKPANIMVGAFGEVLVMDWGLALPLDREPAPDTGQQVVIRREDLSRRIEQIREQAQSDSRISRSGSSQLTMDGAILGTPEYMPPEQAAGDRHKVSPASDVYSLGACLYELLTLAPPFRDEDPYQVVEQVLWSAPVPPRQQRALRLREGGPPLPRIPRSLEAVVLKCLAKLRSERYADAGELSDELQRLLEGEPVRAYPERLPRRLLRAARKHPVLAATGLTSLLLLLGFGLFWQVRSSRQARQDTERRMRSLRKEAAAMRQRNRAQQRLNQELAEKQQRAARRTRALEPYDRGLEFVRRRVRWDQALASFDEAIALDPDFAAAYLQRAEAQVMLGRVEAALADYRRGQQLLAGRSGGWQLARTYLHVGNIYRDVRQDHKQAGEMFRRAAVADPNSIFGRIARISGLSLQQRQTEALALIEKLGAEADHYWEVHLVSGGVLGRPTLPDGRPNPVFDPKRGLAAYNRLIQLRPDYYMGYTLRATLYQQQRDYQRALIDLDQAIVLNAQQAWLYNFRGMLRYVLQRYREALQDIDQASKLDPKNAQYWINRGVLQGRLGRHAEAQRDYEQALRLAPRDLRARVFRGMTHAQLGRLDQALGDYAAAIRLQPGSFLPYSHRALLYRQQRRYVECARDFERAIGLAPAAERGKQFYNRGQLWIETGFLDKALNDFRSAWDAGIEQALVRQCQVMAQAGCFRWAERDADQGMTRLTPAVANALRGDRDRWRGQAEAWEARVRAQPLSLEVRAGLALVASFTRPVEQGRALFRPLLAELRAARGRVVWGLDAGDLLGTYARLCNEAGDSRGAIEANRWAIAAETEHDPATRFQRLLRRLFVAEHLTRLANRASGAEQAALDREAVDELGPLVEAGLVDPPGLRQAPDYAQLARRPTFQAAFGK